MSREPRSRLALAVLIGALGVHSCAASPAHAASNRGGDAVVVEGADNSKALDHGASATVFGLRLPNGAACPGDTQHDQWRVQSFLVPDSIDPGTLAYDATKPRGDGLYALYGSDTKPYVQRATAANTVAGKPGAVVDLPPMSFNVFTPGLVKPGTYRIGIACTLAPERKTAVYWDTQIVITSSSSDHPAGFIWRLASAPASLSKVESGSNAGVIAVVAFAVAALLGLFFWRRSRRTPPSTPTPSTRTRATALSKESR
jgi:hypothetical protein